MQLAVRGVVRTCLDFSLVAGLSGVVKARLLEIHALFHGNESSPSMAAPYSAVYPPSMASSAPVMNDDSSEARNRMALAISSGSPIRPIGTFASRAST